MEQQTSLRNLVIAMVLIGCIMAIWSIFVWGPEERSRAAALPAEPAVTNSTETASGDLDTLSPVELSDAITATQSDQRIEFDGPSMDGSILLRGARVDYLRLRGYYQTIEDKETENHDGEVVLFQPEATGDGFYATYGWQVADGGRLTNAQSQWALVEGTQLTPETPITLQHTVAGLVITRVVEMDENFMFTYTDTVQNTSGSEVGVQPYGMLRQFGKPDDLANFYILHEGLVAATGKNLHLAKYGKLEDGDDFSANTNDGGWIGLTSKYWLGALVPDQRYPFSVEYETVNSTRGQEFRAMSEGAVTVLAPGESVTSENRIFGGAKESATLRAYQDELGIPRFIDAIDWGSMFFWLTKPFFMVLTFINGIVGNFGVAILILTVIVKGIFFPIQSKAYQSMAKMRELAEPMKKIREEIEDKQEQQRRMAELYKEKKVNPVAGCLPIFIQIPVFYGLYKTLFVTIEMRHEPFFLWINDLSAPDPTAIGNLFGLIPISTDALAAIPLLGVVLTVGVLPILYGLTMWALQSMNPPPTDETQKLIFGFLPIIFTFVFAGFAAGLVIYWVWSNFLSMIQQYIIMRQNGVQTGLDRLIEKFSGKKGEAGG
ncbi:MAG: membrane protein insertase YidC [Ponticaulis sp.]|nr:membrane protein insertase YidC [Ponticaulis sp.]